MFYSPKLHPFVLVIAQMAVTLAGGDSKSEVIPLCKLTEAGYLDLSQATSCSYHCEFNFMKKFNVEHGKCCCT